MSAAPHHLIEPLTATAAVLASNDLPGRLDARIAEAQTWRVALPDSWMHDDTPFVRELCDLALTPAFLDDDRSSDDTTVEHYGFDAAGTLAVVRRPADEGDAPFSELIVLTDPAGEVWINRWRSEGESDWTVSAERLIREDGRVFASLSVEPSLSFATIETFDWADERPVASSTWDVHLSDEVTIDDTPVVVRAAYDGDVVTQLVRQETSGDVVAWAAERGGGIADQLPPSHLAR